ncbi:MAG: hypothetical protein V2A69_05160 [Pseudomonadota bacterium]
MITMFKTDVTSKTVPPFFTPFEELLKDNNEEILVNNPLRSACLQRGNECVYATVAANGTEPPLIEGWQSMVFENLGAYTGKWKRQQNLGRLLRTLYSLENYFYIEGSTVRREWFESSLEISNKILDLGKHYIFRDPQEVESFLAENPSLFPLLAAAYPEIRKYFPREKFFLEVVSDPEGRDRKELVLYIRTNLPAEDALYKLGQFDDDWWLDASTEARGKLCIHVEFE